MAVPTAKVLELVQQHGSDTGAIMAATGLSRQRLWILRKQLIASRAIRASDWPRNKHKPFTEAQIRKVIAMRKAGKGYMLIGQAINRSKGAIPRLVKRLEQEGRL